MRRETVYQQTLKPPNHFRFMQACHSDLAIKNQIDNYPGSDYRNTRGDNVGIVNSELSSPNITINLHRLFRYCINPIAHHFGRSNIALTSVYRNKQVNELLGGVEDSQHIYGYEGDIVLTNNIPTSTLFNWCRYNIPEYHQLIWEYPERGVFNDALNVEFSWIHISYIKGDNAKINSLSSTDPKIHDAYLDENTFRLKNFTHKISTANQKLLEE